MPEDIVALAPAPAKSPTVNSSSLCCSKRRIAYGIPVQYKVTDVVIGNKQAMRGIHSCLLLFLVALAPLTTQAAVRASEGTITIPTYLLGPADPNPAFPLLHASPVYPYSMLGDPDLGAEQQQPAFFGRLAFKPTRRQEIVVEGMPLSVQGRNTVRRSVTYHDQTFFVNQTLQSSASLTYLFAGYQYDILSGRAGDLGLSAGGAYLSATGTIHAVEVATSATRSETVGLPLAGVAFRLFPIPGRRWIEVEGGMRGMAFGGYGSYVQAEASGGVGFGPVAFLAGYREVRADLHSTGASSSGVNLHLKGPIFSMQWRW
jgi:hypothetical protein